MITPNTSEKLPAAYIGRLLVKEWEGEAIPHADSTRWLLDMTRRDGVFIIVGFHGGTVWPFLCCNEDSGYLAVECWHRLTGQVLSHHELYGTWQRR